MNILVNSFFCILCSVFLFSCSSDDYTYTPPIYYLYHRDVLLSIETPDGEPYGDYETLLKNKQISMRGVASRKDIPLKVVEEGGIKYLKFFAELPNQTDMKSSKVDDIRMLVTGSSDIILKIGKKQIRLTCSFEGGDYSVPIIADPVITVTAIQYGDNIVKRQTASADEEYKVILRKKADSDDFILTN